MNNVEKIAHDRRLTKFLLAQVKEIRANFHDIWADMELEDVDNHLEDAGVYLEISESELQLALGFLDNLHP